MKLKWRFNTDLQGKIFHLYSTCILLVICESERRDEMFLKMITKNCIPLLGYLK